MLRRTPALLDPGQIIFASDRCYISGSFDLSVTPSDGGANFRIRVPQPLPLYWSGPHELSIGEFAFDLATRTSRTLAPSGYRFIVLSHDRQSALVRGRNDKGSDAIWIAHSFAYALAPALL